MGDMGDLWNDLKEHHREKREKKEPQKKAGARKELERLGWTVRDNDPWSFSLLAPNERCFKYWYFKEYFQQVGGDNHGHGFWKLVNLGSKKAEAKK